MPKKKKYSHDEEMTQDGAPRIPTPEPEEDAVVDPDLIDPVVADEEDHSFDEEEIFGDKKDEF